MAYANGRIPVTLLVHAVNGAPGQVLEAQTANQWAAMVAGAAADGVRLEPEPDGGVSSCYRSLANQQYARNLYESGRGAVAAHPGTSNHGTGIAIDIEMGTGVFAWLSAHAASYGFDHSQGAADNEPWHWVRTQTINFGNITTTEEDDMFSDNDRSALNNVYAALLGTNGKLPSMPHSANLPTAVEDVRKLASAASIDAHNALAYIAKGGPDVTKQIGATDSVFGLVIQLQKQVAALSAKIDKLPK